MGPHGFAGSVDGTEIVAEARHALIIATNRYLDTRLPPLEAPRADAVALKSVLGDAAIGAFDVQVALNKRVQVLRETLEAFFARRARDDLLLVHFSCHGLKDDSGQLYLAAADTKADLLKASAIDADWLRKLMNDCRSEKIAVFLDCCFGGAFATAMTHKVGIDTPGINEHLGGSGRVVITASNAVQYAFEQGSRVGTPEASVFTRSLVNGLRSGEADRNRDGAVTINELFDYLADKVREASPSQTPTKWEFNAAGDWMIAHSDRTPVVSIEHLPPELRERATSPDRERRLAALVGLAALARSADRVKATSARLAIDRLAIDDSNEVSTAAIELRRQLTADMPTEVPAEPSATAAVAAAVVIETPPGGEASPATIEPTTQVVETAVRPTTDATTAEPATPPLGEPVASGLASLAEPSTADTRSTTRGAGVADASAAGAVEVPIGKATYPAEQARGTEAERKARRRRNVAIAAAIAVLTLFGGTLAAVTCVGRTCPAPSGNPFGSSTAGGSATSASASVPDSSPDESPGPASSSPAPLDGILPDSRIVFTATVSKGNLDLWTAAPDGRGIQPLVFGTGNQTDPSWKRDRSKVAFSSPSGIAAVDPDGTGLEVFSRVLNDLNPAWSPDGSTIAFTVQDSRGHNQVQRRPANDLSATPTPLSAATVSAWDPSWSPEGNRIVCASKGGDRSSIRVMRASDGGWLKTLTENDGRIYDDPAWSPVDDWIVATVRANSGAAKQLYLVRSDGTGGKVLAAAGDELTDPAWSPDGQYIAFARGSRIDIVDRTGHAVGGFEHSGEALGFPDWR